MLQPIQRRSHRSTNLYGVKECQNEHAVGGKTSCLYRRAGKGTEPLVENHHLRMYRQNYFALLYFIYSLCTVSESDDLERCSLEQGSNVPQTFSY